MAMGLASERMPREGCMVGLRRGWSGVQRSWSGVTSHPKMGGREARTRPVTTPVRLPDFHIWCGWLVDFEEGPAGEVLASVWACANSTALCRTFVGPLLDLFSPTYDAATRAHVSRPALGTFHTGHWHTIAMWVSGSPEKRNSHIPRSPTLPHHKPVR